MTYDKAILLESLLSSYETYFDITRSLNVSEISVDAFAEFHSRSEKYVLVKAAKLWAAESNEYIYFISVSKLDLQTWQHIYDIILKDGLSKIKPHSEHMYSYVSLVILADEIDEGVKGVIKRTRYRKSFKFSFQGWMEFRVSALDISCGKAIFNPNGKDLANLLEKHHNKLTGG